MKSWEDWAKLFALIIGFLLLVIIFLESMYPGR